MCDAKLLWWYQKTPMTEQFMWYVHIHWEVILSNYLEPSMFLTFVVSVHWLSISIHFSLATWVLLQSFHEERCSQVLQVWWGDFSELFYLPNCSSCIAFMLSEVECYIHVHAFQISYQILVHFGGMSDFLALFTWGGCQHLPLAWMRRLLATTSSSPGHWLLIGHVKFNV